MSGKRIRESRKLVEGKKCYSLKEAVEILKKFQAPKFDESIDLAFKLTVDPKQSDQMVRGTAALPHGSGKKVRILAFAEGAQAVAAKNAGAEYVGYKDLIAKIKGGWFDFDVAVATPDTMQEVRKLGKELGPKGLMPNPKTGTVAEDLGKAVEELKAGRVEFKLDKNANVQVCIGKASFDAEKILQNARSVIDALVKARPASAKGTYLQSCTISRTMSPGIRIDTHEFLAA